MLFKLDLLRFYSSQLHRYAKMNNNDYIEMCESQSSPDKTLDITTTSITESRKFGKDEAVLAKYGKKQQLRVSFLHNNYI